MDKYNNRYTNNFITFFDGVYDFPAKMENLNTFILGVCKLEYYEPNNTLHVWLRRPGLLIGKAGSTIKKVEDYLECEIYVHEVILTNPKKSL